MDVFPGQYIHAAIQASFGGGNGNIAVRNNSCGVCIPVLSCYIVGFQFDFPFVGKYQVFGGMNGAAHINAHTGSGAYQVNASCIHAAQGAYVQGDSFFVIVFGCLHGACVIMHPALADSHMDVIFSKEGAVNGCCPAVYIQFICPAVKNPAFVVINRCISFPFHGNSPGHVKAGEYAVFYDRMACGQGGSSHINETEAVSCNAIGVGNNKIRPAACNFHHALKAGAVFTQGFHQDGPGSIS